MVFTNLSSSQHVLHGASHADASAVSGIRTVLITSPAAPDALQGRGLVPKRHAVYVSTTYDRYTRHLWSQLLQWTGGAHITPLCLSSACPLLGVMEVHPPGLGIDLAVILQSDVGKSTIRDSSEDSSTHLRRAPSLIETLTLASTRLQIVWQTICQQWHIPLALT